MKTNKTFIKEQKKNRNKKIRIEIETQKIKRTNKYFLVEERENRKKTIIDDKPLSHL
jgi:hypothetical protein